MFLNDRYLHRPHDTNGLSPYHYLGKLIHIFLLSEVQITPSKVLGQKMFSSLFGTSCYSATCCRRINISSVRAQGAQRLFYASSQVRMQSPLSLLCLFPLYFRTFSKKKNFSMLTYGAVPPVAIRSSAVTTDLINILRRDFA